MNRELDELIIEIDGAIEARYQKIKNESKTLGELKKNIHNFCTCTAWYIRDYAPAIQSKMSKMFDNDIDDLPLKLEEKAPPEKQRGGETISHIQQ